MVAPCEILIRSFLRNVFRPAERLTPAQWCARYLRMPVGHSETKPGPVDFSRSPYLVEPLNALATPGVTDVVMSAPTRLGKTFLLRMVFAYCVAAAPSPMLWVDSTMDKGASVVKKELQPLVEANPVLRARKPANRHHYSTREMLFPAAPLNVYGANSESQVAGDTVKVVLGNEVGKWRGATEEEAAILELVRHRTESFDDERKHYFSSTPTTEESLFWQEVERGDLRKYYVPCPQCGTMQSLEWDHVVWPSDARRGEGQWDLGAVARGARYSCINPECPCHDPGCTRHSGWTDEQRLAAIWSPAAHWRPTKEGLPGVRSYSITGLYGHLKVNRLGELAVAFLSAKQGAFFADLQDFWNSRMGLPTRENVVDLKAKRLTHLERQYDRSSLPAGFRPDVLIVGFDVQTYGFPYVVRAFAWSGESYLVDHGCVPTWADLEQVQTDYAPLCRTSYVVGDMNFEDRRAETLEQIWNRRSRGWLAADGVEFSKDRVRVDRANVFRGGKLAKENITVPRLVISTYDFKRELEERFVGTLKNWHLYQLPLTAEGAEVEEFAEYKSQLLDERRVPRKRRRAGQPAYEFRPRTGNNHAFDCEVYALGLFYVLQRKKSFAKRVPGAARRRVVQVARGSAEKAAAQ